LRADRPALRYGRFYFRPVSGDGATVGVSTSPQGILAFSRILNDDEVVVVANTNTDSAQTLSVDVIVDQMLNRPGVDFQILYSNKPNSTAPDSVRATGTVVVQEIDGSTGTGPLHVLKAHLQPMEIQILGR
jgi:hypothetical protein